MSEQLTKSAEIELPIPETTHQYRDFFRKKAETPGESEYQGYDKCADLIANAIEDTVMAAKQDKVTEVDVSLTPDKLASYGLYTREMTEPSAALIELAIYITGARYKYDRQFPTGHKYLWQGRYDGQPVNFIETISNEENPNVTLSIGTKVPKAFLAPPEEPSVSAEDKNAMWDDILDIRLGPTAKEPKRVRRFIKQHRQPPKTD